MSGNVFYGSLPPLDVAVFNGDAAAKTIEVDRYLRIATADDGQTESERFHNSGESGGVACAVAADDNTVGFRHFARYLVRQQSAYLHHVDVVGGLAALHGFEVGVGHVRVRIDTYILYKVATGAVERFDERGLVALLIACGDEGCWGGVVVRW